MRLPLSLAWLATVLMATAACDSLLSVDSPDRVTEPELDDPMFAEPLVIGAIADFECAWDRYAASASLFSGEWIGTDVGTLPARWYPLRRIDRLFFYGTGDCSGSNTQHYVGLHTARFQADDVFERLNAYPVADLPESVRIAWQATLRAYGGWTLLALGETHCRVMIDGGPIMDPREALLLAQERFDEAISLSGQDTTVGEAELLAYAGRARVRLDLDDFDGAVADAGRLPQEYEAWASRDGGVGSRWNMLWWQTAAREVTIADDYRVLTFDVNGAPTTGTGTPDPRVMVVTDGDTLVDNVTLYFYPAKNYALEEDVPITSYVDAQLIIAEASARNSDVTTARTAINGLRSDAGLPTFTGPIGSPEEMVDLVLEERRRWLFLESGARLNDLIRFRGTVHEIPFLGEPGSIHPNGRTPTGLTYGDAICFPLAAEDEFGG